MLGCQNKQTNFSSLWVASKKKKCPRTTRSPHTPDAFDCVVGHWGCCNRWILQEWGRKAVRSEQPFNPSTYWFDKHSQVLGPSVFNRCFPLFSPGLITKMWARRQVLTGVVEGHFFLDNAAALLHLSAQLRLAPPQLLLAAGTAQKLQSKRLTFRSRAGHSHGSFWGKHERWKYHSSVRILHSFASLSRVCVFSYENRKNCWRQRLNVKHARVSWTRPCRFPSPLIVLCRPAASRLCPCTLCWARWWRPGAAPTGPPAPVVEPSARPPASCAARLLRKTGSRSQQDQCKVPAGHQRRGTSKTD